MERETVAIIGVGLIGASLGLALKRAGFAARIVGAGRRRETLNTAHEIGAIDAIAATPAEAARKAAIVVIATPMRAYRAILEAIAGAIGPETVITDAGSTKRHALDAAHAALEAGARRFVGAHPIAGSERSGPAAARADLFEQRTCILTPEGASAEATQRIEAMWRAAGARIALMSAEAHDRLFARVSHLPHLAAYALVGAILRLAGGEDPFRFAGAGFRDFTRIASSSPEMWRDIALTNRAALIEALDAYRGEIDRLREAVAAGDGATIERMFAEAKRARDDWLHRCIEGATTGEAACDER